MDGTYEMQDELYQCVGYCQADEESGCCLGCGRPLFPGTSFETERQTERRPDLGTTENRFPVDPLM